jgi:hypothetical protein
MGLQHELGLSSCHLLVLVKPVSFEKSHFALAKPRLV